METLALCPPLWPSQCSESTRRLQLSCFPDKAINSPSLQLSFLNTALIGGNKNPVLTTLNADTCPKCLTRRKHVSCTFTELRNGNGVEKSEKFTEAKMTSSKASNTVTRQEELSAPGGYLIYTRSRRDVL